MQCVVKVGSNNVDETNTLITMYHNPGAVPAESKHILSLPLALNLKAHKAKAAGQ